MSWIHCTKFSRQTQLIFANCTIFFQKNSISHHHFIQNPPEFVLIVVTVSILLNIYNNLHHLLTIPDKNHHLSPNYRVQFILIIYTLYFPSVSFPSPNSLCIFSAIRLYLHYLASLFPESYACNPPLLSREPASRQFNICEHRVTPTLAFRRVLRSRNVSGVASRPERKRVTDMNCLLTGSTTRKTKRAASAALRIPQLFG